MPVRTVAAALALALVVPPLAIPAAARAGDPAVITKTSAHDVPTTLKRLEDAIASRGAKVIAKVDHAAAAKAVGEDLRPTTVLIFGNPKVGTPLMQTAQQAGLDLPLRVLVWQDANGAVRIAYRKPDQLLGAHDIAGRTEEINKMTVVLAAVAEEAARQKP